MESEEYPYYRGNLDWSRKGSRNQFNGRGSQHVGQPFQNQYPEELRKPGRQANNARNMRNKKARSAVSPLVKHFLFVINVLFLAVGLGLMSLSIYILVESEEEENEVNCFQDFLFNPACLLCLGGCLVWVPSFMGCYGALRENTCVVKMYLAFAIFLIFIEVLAAVFILTFTLSPESLSSIGIYPSDFLDKSIQKYGDRLHQEDGCGRDSDSYLDLIQDKFSCCGFSDDDEGYLDWEKNQYYSCNSTSPQACSVPISCCKTDTIVTSDCGANLLRKGTTDLTSIYTRGCEKGMRQILKDNIIMIAVGIGGGILIQVLFIRCAMSLNSQVKEQRMKW